MSADLADFVLDFCRFHGGMVEPPAYGVHDVLLPDELAAQLGIEPFQRFAFNESAAAAGITHLAYGHPLVERMVDLARAAPACACFYVNDVRLAVANFPERARAALAFPNAKLETVPGAIETRLLCHYVRFHFKAALVSDEKREQLVSVLLDAQTGAPAAEFSAAEAYRLARTSEFRGLPSAATRWAGPPPRPAPEPLAAETLQALLPRAAAAARERLAEPLAALQARAARLLELDRARLDAYYGGMTRDLERRLKRAEDDARRTTLTDKLAAARADHAAKLADAEAKHALRLELELISVAVIAQPKLGMPMAIENRQARAQRDVFWDPLRMDVEPLLCDVCGQPSSKLFLCANGHLADERCLAPQCVDCKRVYCRDCAGELTECAVCRRPVCRKSLTHCGLCGQGTCREHEGQCHAPAAPAEPAAQESTPPEASAAPRAAPEPAPPARSWLRHEGRKPVRPPLQDRGYRLQVEITEEVPSVTAFVVAKSDRDVARRTWELTPQGIRVECECEKGEQCPEPPGMMLAPMGVAQIDAQMAAEIERLCTEYRIPPERVVYGLLRYGAWTTLSRMRLPGAWKDPAALEQALLGFSRLWTGQLFGPLLGGRRRKKPAPPDDTGSA